MDAIKIQNVTKHYDGFSIKNLDLTIPKGTVMGLVGQNGAGKTTVIKLILNMVKRDSGKITVMGTDNHTNEFTSLKEDIGIVLGEMGIAGCLTGKQINKIMANIYKNWNSDIFTEYLKKFDVPSDKEYKDLSKGMKMKVGIAVAMSHEPKLLILDEATSGLDPVARDEILDILMDFTRNEEHSILMSSHIVSDLEKACDYIAFLHKGKLMLMEEKDKLKEDYAVIHISEEEYKTIPPSVIRGKRKNPYGVDVLLKKENIPSGVSTSSVSIEDLFIFMAKEA